MTEQPKQVLSARTGDLGQTMDQRAAQQQAQLEGQTSSNLGAAVSGAGDATAGGGGGEGSGDYSTPHQIDQTPAGAGMTYGTLAGLVNGSNKRYTTSAGSYISGQLEVERNGVGQSQGSDLTWVETDPSAGTFDFNTAPLSGDHIKVRYNT